MLFRSPKDLSDLAIDYEKVRQEKDKMREQSIAFLDKAVNGKKRVDKTNYDLREINSEGEHR